MNYRKLAYGLLSIVVGGGIFATATMVDLSTSDDIGAEITSFFGVRQNGVAIERQANATLIAFDLKDKVDESAIARLMRLWTSDSAELTAGQPIIGDPQGEMAENPARLTILVGYGFSLFEKVGAVDRWPLIESSIPSYAIDRLEERWSGGDLILQIAGDNPQSIFHAAQVLERDAKPFATVRWQQRGFLDPAGINSENISRNLMGQIDGTANKKVGTPELSQILWVKDGLLRDGTTMVVRRIRMNLDSWNLLSTNKKSGVIGRDLAEGGLMESASAQAHQSRAFTKGTSGIFRRGFNYDDNYLENGKRDAGLIFISFQAKLKSYLDIQARLNAEDELNKWTTPVGSALFIVPAGVEDGEYLGQEFFN